MGSGDWFKNLICLNRSKKSKCKHSNKEGNIISNGASKKNVKFRHLTEEVAATKIKSAYRAYKAKKALRRLKGVDKFRVVIEEGHYSVKNQAMSALNHIHFWSRIQSEIKARWLSMVVESRARQKKMDDQLKLEAKLHDLEVEWSGGPETMEEIVNRVQQREVAAAKRERTLAYAFSHQWRANSNQCFGQSYYDLSKEGWGWSWKERWVAVRPWEKRYQTRPSLINKLNTKLPLSNGKASTHATRSSKVYQNGVA